jgi:hypothetical protein
MPADKTGIQIQPIAAFSDNYIWLLYNSQTRADVAGYLKARQL